MSLLTRYLVRLSNVSRFYRAEDFPNFTICNMSKCCTTESFRARMESLEEKEKEVIVSVIENLFCDAVGTIKDKNRLKQRSKK